MSVGQFRVKQKRNMARSMVKRCSKKYWKENQPKIISAVENFTVSVIEMCRSNEIKHITIFFLFNSRPYLKPVDVSGRLSNAEET